MDFVSIVYRYVSMYVCVCWSTHSDDLKAQTQICLDTSNETITKYTQQRQQQQYQHFL